MTAKLENYSKLVPNGQNLMECEGKQYTDIRAMKLYGCSFQAPSCLTQTRTDGNATVAVLFGRASSQSIMITHSLSFTIPFVVNYLPSYNHYIISDYYTEYYKTFGYMLGITWS